VNALNTQPLFGNTKNNTIATLKGTISF
jgi:hypothetical protein